MHNDSDLKFGDRDPSSKKKRIYSHFIRQAPPEESHIWKSEWLLTPWINYIKAAEEQNSLVLLLIDNNKTMRWIAQEIIEGRLSTKNIDTKGLVKRFPKGKTL